MYKVEILWRTATLFFFRGRGGIHILNTCHHIICVYDTWADKIKNRGVFFTGGGSWEPRHIQLEVLFIPGGGGHTFGIVFAILTLLTLKGRTQGPLRGRGIYLDGGGWGALK